MLLPASQPQPHPWLLPLGLFQLSSHRLQLLLPARPSQPLDATPQPPAVPPCRRGRSSTARPHRTRRVRSLRRLSPAFAGFRRLSPAFAGLRRLAPACAGLRCLGRADCAARAAPGFEPGTFGLVCPPSTNWSIRRCRCRAGRGTEPYPRRHSYLLTLPYLTLPFTLRQTFVLKLPNFRFAFRGTCHLTFVKLSFFSRCDVVDNGPFWSGPGDGVAIPTLCSGRVVLFGLKGPRPPQKVRISADFRPNLAFEPNPRRNFRFSGRNFRFSAKT